MGPEHRARSFLARILASSLLSAVASYAWAPIVHAHGEYPQAEWVLVDPADPDTIVISATFGLAVTEDGGATWDWICPVAANPASAFLDGRALLVPERTVLLGLSTGMALGEELGCGLTDEAAPLGQTPVTDLSPVHGAPGHAYALVFESGATGVYRTEDGGRSWTPVATQPAAELLGHGLRLAPSDPTRIYVSGRYQQEGAVVYRSDDAGQSWQRLDFEARADEFAFRVLQVDPEDADRFYVLAQGERHDRLVRSDDGGESFRDVTTLSAPPLTAGRHFGLAFDAHGVAWFGNTEEGLWREDATEAVSVNSDLSVACLRFQDGELWACGDGKLNGFAVGRSADGSGQHFTPLLRFADIGGIRSCGEGHPIEERCEPYWEALQVQLGLGTDETPAGSTSGGCIIGGARSTHPWPIGAAAAWLLAARRRSRRRWFRHGEGRQAPTARRGPRRCPGPPARGLHGPARARRPRRRPRGPAPAGAPTG